MAMVVAEGRGNTVATNDDGNIGIRVRSIMNKLHESYLMVFLPWLISIGRFDDEFLAFLDLNINVLLKLVFVCLRNKILY
jgi:hypothetical protein